VSSKPVRVHGDAGELQGPIEEIGSAVYTLQHDEGGRYRTGRAARLEGLEQMGARR
jgi:hypothetical protein